MHCSIINLLVGHLLHSIASAYAGFKHIRVQLFEIE